jgi:hypothetical protein
MDLVPYKIVKADNGDAWVEARRQEAIRRREISRVRAAAR